MRRIRIAFVLLAVALAVAGGLLVQRALRAVDLERDARRVAVAERVFDEMERTLSRVLAEEEARPHEAYGFYVTPEGAPEEVRLRSPLSHVSEVPFVVGHFQVDGDGQVYTPLAPRDLAEAAARGDTPLPPEQEQRAQRVIAVARAYAAERGPETALPVPPPGVTWGVGSREGTLAEVAVVAVPKKAKREAELQAEPEPDRPAEAYEVLQSLNRGAADREQRERKVYKSQPSLAAGRSAARLDVSQLARRPASPLAASAPVATLEDADDAIAADALEEADARDAAPAAPLELEEQVTRLERLERLERVAVDPLVGRLVPGGELLLTRTVLIGDRGLRQGLVIEPEPLERALRATLPRGVPVARFQLVEPGAPPTGTAYRHRFAEPFDPIAAELVLGPIASGRGSLAVTALAGLFVAASALGLFALYRMTAVTVEFAERRGNFVAAVSHELKTPLTAIRMYAEMLRDGLVPNEAKQREYFASITTESERLSRLINNVLEFSRLEKGTHSVDLRVGDVRPVVLEAVELLAPHAERHGQRLELDAPEGLPTVRFERDALLQVLFNLVDNAVKYAKDASEPVIRVSLREKAGGVELRVRDHGPGVPPGQERRILEPFHRAEDELTRRTQGTGIGLALVRGLVEEMGAAFDVGDAEGGGFEARIRLAPA